MRRGRERDTGIWQRRSQQDMKKEQEEERETPGGGAQCEPCVCEDHEFALTWC